MKRSRIFRPFQFFSQWGNHVHFCSVKNGDLIGFGDNSFGQLGIGRHESISVHIPTKVPFFERKSKGEMFDVSHGGNTSFFHTSRGTFSCGSNDNGELSIDKTYWHRELDQVSCFFPEPLPVKLAGSAKNSDIVSARSALSCVYFLLRDGFVYSAGSNTYGQLGHGDKDPRRNGTKIESLKEIVEVTPGFMWVIFKSKRGLMFCCGDNSHNHLSPQTQVLRVPVQISFQVGNEVISPSFIVPTRRSSYYFVTNKAGGMKKKYDVYVRGHNRQGELGEGNYFPVDSLKKSEEMSGCDLFCNGHSFSFVVFRKDDSLFGCGWSGRAKRSCSRKYSSFGYDKSLAVRTFPTPKKLEGVPAGDVVQIVTTNLSTFLICKNGDLYGTGLLPKGKSLMENEDKFRKFTLLKEKVKIKKSFGRKYLERKERLDFLLENINKDFEKRIIGNLVF